MGKRGKNNKTKMSNVQESCKTMDNAMRQACKLTVCWACWTTVSPPRIASVAAECLRESHCPVPLTGLTVTISHCPHLASFSDNNDNTMHTATWRIWTLPQTTQISPQSAIYQMFPSLKIYTITKQRYHCTSTKNKIHKLYCLFFFYLHNKLNFHIR